MRIRHVRYFLALCDELNFGQAAKRCNVAQPSLSNAIKNLEQQLGGQLFYRNHASVRMTELGRLVEPCLQRIERNWKLAHQKARKFTAKAHANRSDADYQALHR